MFDSWRERRWESRDIKRRLEIVWGALNLVIKRSKENGGVIRPDDVLIWDAAHSEITFSRQMKLIRRLTRAGISIPPLMWTELTEPEVEIVTNEGVSLKTHRTLTQEGEAWARHELTKRRREGVEFWARIVLPIIALIISILAFVRKR